MNIKKDVYKKVINSIRTSLPEEGGILGAINGVVEFAQLDIGTYSGRGCSYSPDVNFLNRIISEWQNNGIEFQGIFHTHFFGVETLSQDDLQYIEIIMRSMPTRVNFLYFPIVVMPDKKFIVYKASKCGSNIVISQDDISFY